MSSREIKAKYEADDIFWHFADELMEKVGFSLSNFEPEAFDKLLSECDRQYSYIKENHPVHYQAMCDRLTGKYMSLLRTTAFLTELANSKEISFDPLGTKAKNAEMIGMAETLSANLSLINPVSEGSPMPAVLSSDDVSNKVMEFEAKVGNRIVATHQIMTMEGSIYMSDEAILVHVQGIHGTESCTQTDPLAEKEGLLSIMEGKVLTGEHRGTMVVIETPIFYPDGTYHAQGWVQVEEEHGATTPRPRHLSDDELIKLATADLLELSGREITLFEVSAYIGDTSDQEIFAFEDGIPAVVDELSEANIASCYRIDNGNNGGNVIDVFVDISSDHPEAQHLRSLWSHGTSYYSDGTVEPSREFKLKDIAPEYGTSPGL